MIVSSMDTEGRDSVVEVVGIMIIVVLKEPKESDCKVMLSHQAPALTGK